MKKIWTLVLVLVLAVSAMFVFTACDKEPEEPTVVETFYKVTYVYQHGYKTTELSTQQVSDIAGFTAEQIAALDSVKNNGYGFSGWYADADCTVPFDFTQKPTADVTVYASRGNLAGDNVEWFPLFSGDGFVLMFSGTGAMYDYENKSDAPWADIAPLVYSVSFGEGITKIGNYTCADLTSVSSVYVPKSVVAIGDYAFSGSGVKHVSMRNGVKTIGASAFAACNNLTDLVLPADLETLGENALYDVPALTSVTFWGDDIMEEPKSEGKNFKFADNCFIDLANKTLLFAQNVATVTVDESVEIIADGAFFNKTALTEVVLPTKLVEIGENAFNGCTALKSVSVFDTEAPLINGQPAVFYLPSGVKKMGKSAFANCSMLVGAVVLPEGLPEIPDGCFYHVLEISAIVIPKSVTNIGPTAFKVPDNNGGYRNLLLKSAYYGGTEAEWNKVTKGVDNYRLFDKAMFYFYSETEPAAAGPYWYYLEGEDGEDLGIRQWYHTIRYATVSPSNARQLLFVFNDFVKVDDVENNTSTLTVANKEYMDAIEVNGYKYGGFYQITKHAFTNANRTDITNTFSVINFVYEGDNATKLDGDIWIGALRSNILSADGGITYTTGTSMTIEKKADTNTITYSDKTFDYAALSDTQFVWNAAGKGDNKGNTARRRDTVVSVTIKVDTEGNCGIKYFGAYSLASFAIPELVLPKDVESVHYTFVDNSTVLKNIYYEGTTPLKVVNDKGEEVALNQPGVTIYTKYVAGETDTTKNGAYWTEIDGEKIVWSLKDGALTIGGAAEMPNFAAASDAPWAEANITSVSFDAGITHIGENILNGKTSVATIKLPATVKVIPTNAFEGTAAITNLAAAADGCGYIDGHLIKVVDASKIGTRFDIPRNIYSVQAGAFEAATSLKEVYVIRNVNYIAPDAFGTNVETIYYDGLPATWEKVVGKDNYTDVDVYYATISTPTIDKWQNYTWFTIQTEPDSTGFRKIDVYDSDNFVTVTFDVDGATTEVVYIDGIGGAFTVPTPTKAGYTFDGWADEDGTVYTKVTVELLKDGDVTLTAKWKKS